MTYAIVRVRGPINIHPGIQDTMKMLRLSRPNHCVIVPADPSHKGMLGKIKDYVTYGEVDASTLGELIRTRGRLYGDKPIDDAYVSNATGGKYKTVADFANAVAQGKAKLKELGEDAKLVFRLSPPAGGYEGIKRHHTIGGALGYRGKEINDLIRRML